MFLRYILVVVSLYGSAQGSSVNKVNNFSIICLKLNKNKTHYDTLYIVHIILEFQRKIDIFTNKDCYKSNILGEDSCQITWIEIQ